MEKFHPSKYLRSVVGAGAISAALLLGNPQPVSAGPLASEYTLGKATPISQSTSPDEGEVNPIVLIGFVSAFGILGYVAASEILKDFNKLRQAKKAAEVEAQKKKPVTKGELENVEAEAKKARKTADEALAKAENHTHDKKDEKGGKKESKSLSKKAAGGLAALAVLTAIYLAKDSPQQSISSSGEQILTPTPALTAHPTDTPPQPVETLTVTPLKDKSPKKNIHVTATPKVSSAPTPLQNTGEKSEAAVPLDIKDPAHVFFMVLLASPFLAFFLALAKNRRKK